MKITPLDYNIHLLSKYWDLNTSRVSKKAYASIDEVLDKNVASQINPILNHNNDDVKVDSSFVYNALIGIDKRHKILMFMDVIDLLTLLFLLDKEKLVSGMYYFSLQKLLKFISRLPKDLLLKALLMFMSQETLLGKVGKKELFSILGSPKISEDMIIKFLDSLPTVLVIQLLESIMGEYVGKMKHSEVLENLSEFKKREILQGLLTMPSNILLQLVLNFTLNDPALLLEMSRDSLFKPFTRVEKSKLVGAFLVLDKSDIIKLLGILPKDLIAQVACMLGPQILSEIIFSQFSNLFSLIADMG